MIREAQKEDLNQILELFEPLMIKNHKILTSNIVIETITA